MLELKRKAIIISLGLVAFLLIGTVGCIQQRSKRSGKNLDKEKVLSGIVHKADTIGISQSKADSILTDSIQINISGDSIRLANGQTVPRDSTAADTLSGPDDLQNIVKYTSEDSTIMAVDLKEVHLYGNAEVNYGTINLKANYIKLNWITNEVYAIGTYDSTSKKMAGEPIFQDGSQIYNTKEIRYNFKSKKALIQGIVTSEGDGNIRGEKVKKDAEGNFYIQHSMYTTCNLTHPHYFINAPKIKMVNQKQVISGPFNLVISDVPLPIALPFGFFPMPKKKEIGSSGVIIPT